jgi:hypothetical protein
VQRADAIQRHPLSIKIDGYNPWERDTEEIDIDTDIDLFRQTIDPNNPLVTSIEIRKKSIGDHQVVVVGTEDGKFTQMDLASMGSMLRYNVNRAHYNIVVNSFTPNDELRLYDVFRRFYEVTHARGFNFLDYNCERFASDLAGKMSPPDEDAFM